MAETTTLGATPSAASGSVGRDQSAADAEGRLRAGTYSILASLLGAPPTGDLLRCLEGIETEPSPDEPTGDSVPDSDSDDAAQAWRQISRAAAGADLRRAG